MNAKREMYLGATCKKAARLRRVGGRDARGPSNHLTGPLQFGGEPDELIETYDRAKYGSHDQQPGLRTEPAIR